MSRPKTYEEAMKVLDKILKEIHLFSLICLEGEYTDTDEVWVMLSSFNRMCGGPPTVAAVPDFDALVLDHKGDEASAINNEGVRGQLQYLQEVMGPGEFTAMIEGRELEHRKD